MNENELERRLQEILGKRPKGPMLNTENVSNDENVKMGSFRGIAGKGGKVKNADAYESEFGAMNEAD